MENKRNMEVVDKRKAETKEALIDALKKMPIIEVAVKRVGISRDTYYRWRLEDEGFLKRSKDAMEEGVEFINDMSESQIISLIKDRSFQAIQLWLKQHHPSYKQKDFQAGFAITESGDKTIFEIFANLDPETEEFRNFYLKKTNNDGSRESKI
jgi:hypothetical protein